MRGVRWSACIHADRSKERRDPIEINISGRVEAIRFSTNGEYLLSGGSGGVDVWRVEDGQKMATMPGSTVYSLAVSNDGKLIAAGTTRGEVYVWDATTYKRIFEHSSVDIGKTANGVDFSLDSTRLVSASDNQTACVWDITTRKQVLLLRPGASVYAAKYSPQGDRIATATPGSVRVYDSNDGHLLVNIQVDVTPYYNTGLLWFNSHLLVISAGKIKEFDASTGSAVSEWSVPDIYRQSCMALPKHGKFVACSTLNTVTLWDASTHTQLGIIQCASDIRSIAISPDDCFLAIGGVGDKIVIERLSRINVSAIYCQVTVYLNDYVRHPLASNDNKNIIQYRKAKATIQMTPPQYDLVALSYHVLH